MNRDLALILYFASIVVAITSFSLSLYLWLVNLQAFFNGIGNGNIAKDSHSQILLFVFLVLQFVLLGLVYGCFRATKALRKYIA